MKQFNLILFTLLFYNCTQAQWQLQPTIGLSHSLSLFGSYNTQKIASISGYSYNRLFYRTAVPYQTTNINGGVTLVHLNYSLSFKVEYQYFVCKQQMSIGFSNLEKEIMNDNFIGLIIANRFRETKIVRPFFSIKLSSEFSTNYRNKYLDAENYDPVRYFNSPPFPEPWNTNINYYQSTPFIGNLLVGCDFRLYRGLSVNASFGYGLRVLKAQYGILYYHPSMQDKPIAEKKIGKPYTIGLNYLTIELGLNYTFSFKKKPKTETP